MCMHPLTPSYSFLLLAAEARPLPHQRLSWLTTLQPRCLAMELLGIQEFKASPFAAVEPCPSPELLSFLPCLEAEEFAYALEGHHSRNCRKL